MTHQNPIVLLSSGCSINIDELILQLTKLRSKFKSPKMIIEAEIDYTGCYYEGDTPSATAELKIVEQ